MSCAVVDWEGVETLMTRRFVVVGVMPKRRKDSAIYRLDVKIERCDCRMRGGERFGQRSGGGGGEMGRCNQHYYSDSARTQSRNVHFDSVVYSLRDHLEHDRLLITREVSR